MKWFAVRILSVRRGVIAEYKIHPKVACGMRSSNRDAVSMHAADVVKKRGAPYKSADRRVTGRKVTRPYTLE